MQDHADRRKAYIISRRISGIRLSVRIYEPIGSQIESRLNALGDWTVTLKLTRAAHSTAPVRLRVPHIKTPRMLCAVVRAAYCRGNRPTRRVERA
jgi:hypothetical protein